jgi:hypothetical protein
MRSQPVTDPNHESQAPIAFGPAKRPFEPLPRKGCLKNLGSFSYRMGIVDEVSKKVMLTEANLFAMKLQMESLWCIEEIRFNAEGSMLEIFIDFERGSTFYFKDDELGVGGCLKASKKA